MASSSAKKDDNDCFLSRRVPDENMPSLGEQLMPLGKFLETLKASGKIYADLAFGNPHDPPLSGLTKALCDQITTITTNPSPELFQYQREYPNEKQAILESLQRRRGSSYASLTTNHIWITNGAFGGLMMAMKSFLNVGDAVVTVIPEYFGYPGMIQGLECTSIGVPLSPDDDFDLNVPAISQALRDNLSTARMLLLTSPNNPSGQMYSSQKLQELAQALQQINRERKEPQLPPVILLSDEAYHRIIFPSTHRAYVSPASFYEYTISIYSYAKTCMAPSERLGWLVLSPFWPDDKLVMTGRALTAAQIATGWLSPSATNARCIPALEHGHGVRVDLHGLESRRDRLVSMLNSHGIHNVFPHVINPHSGFYILIRVPDAFLPTHDFEFVKLLAERYRVVAMHGSVMGLPGWIRMSVTASRAMIEHTCAAIHAFVLDYESNDPSLEPWLPKTN